ncbi:hypothetical protein PDY_08780 [Photobacterium damselae subsp. damselae]|nr:hypothetical protein PDY_08780 [Photobacterium damselae subsp. damselae]
MPRICLNVNLGRNFTLGYGLCQLLLSIKTQFIANLAKKPYAASKIVGLLSNQSCQYPSINF